MTPSCQGCSGRMQEGQRDPSGKADFYCVTVRQSLHCGTASAQWIAFVFFTLQRFHIPLPLNTNTGHTQEPNFTLITNNMALVIRHWGIAQFTIENIQKLRVQQLIIVTTNILLKLATLWEFNSTTQCSLRMWKASDVCSAKCAWKSHHPYL